MLQKTKYSLLTVILLTLAILVFRIDYAHDREISWDVFGYYLYLPATFIHHDPLLENTDWISKANETYNLTETVYQVTHNDKNEPVYFFLMGMSLFYLPLFLVGHLLAFVLGFPMDGFSAPYQYSLAIGAVVYTVFGLIFLRKVLLEFVDDKVAAIILFLIMLATNTIEHLTIKNLETINVLFMLSAMVLWFTIRFYESHKSKYLYMIAVLIGLMVLVKPSEGFILLIPVFWGLTNIGSIQQRLQLWWNKRLAIAISVGLVVVIFLPQLIYWKIQTGSIIFDSYNNPGVGLDFFHPHVIDVLFSFRKGWIIYTPIMILVFVGLGYVSWKKPSTGMPILIFVLIEFWIVSSWTEWWYGAAFSCRPMIVTFPMLFLTLAIFIQSIKSRKTMLVSILSICGLCVSYNLFKWWQMQQGILDPYRMSKAYFLVSFWETDFKPELEELKLVNRSHASQQKIKHEHLYSATTLLKTAFEEDTCTSESSEFIPLMEEPFQELTDRDHIWLRHRLKLNCLECTEDDEVLLIATIEREEGTYGYTSFRVDESTLQDTTRVFTADFLTPEIREGSDRVKSYIWNRSDQKLCLKSAELLKLERDH